MAIPDNPNWSDLTEPLPYPTSTLTKPPAQEGVHAIALGPAQLNMSSGKLNQRYWMVSQDGGVVSIRGSIL